MALLKQGIEFEPHYSPSSSLLAEIYARTGDAERARQIAEKALVYNPGDAELRRVLEMDLAEKND